MIDHQKQLERAQTAAKGVHDRMLEALIGYSPCHQLTVGDVQYISEWARTIAFEAIRECQPDA